MELRGVLFLSRCAMATDAFAQADGEAPPKNIRVTLLGTAQARRHLADWVVFSHSPGTTAIVEQTRRHYAGGVEMREDLIPIRWAVLAPVKREAERRAR